MGEEGTFTGSLECIFLKKMSWIVWLLYIGVSAMKLGEGNRFFRLGKLLCLTFLLFAASAANASPTVTRRGAELPDSLSLTNTQTTTSDSINTVVKPVRAELANLAKEFLQPPENSSGLLDAHNNSIRSLPAVPATVLMLLSGFLCVSLYRDRKVWLMVLMGLLWAGQAGIQTLPRLAHHFSHKNHTKQQIRAQLTYPHYLENSRRLCSDVKDTRYVGLLRHLGGIPDNKSTANLHTTQPAIIFQPDTLSVQFHCLAPKAMQFICFLPAFIFETIPRGPPELV